MKICYKGQQPALYWDDDNGVSVIWIWTTKADYLRGGVEQGQCCCYAKYFTK